MGKMKKIKPYFIGFDRMQCQNCERWFRFEKAWKFVKPLLLFDNNKRLNRTYYICSKCASCNEDAEEILHKSIEEKRPKYEKSIKKEDAILYRKRK